MSAPIDLDAYERGVLAGDRTTLGRAITLVESRLPAHQELAQELLTRLLPKAGRSIRVGITGVPGVGKSTFIDALGTHLTAKDHKVAVLAVDPSSTRTGGSILGDKTRMARLATDPRAFIRPSPTAGTLGGVAAATREAMVIVEAAGYDVVLVETVGVGQSEAGVIDLVDTLIFVAQPAAGDLIQSMKAGILEWPDVFFVNKSDLGDVAGRAVAELKAGLDLSHRRDPERTPPVLSGSARDGVGIDALIDAIDEHARWLKQSGRGAERSRTGREARIRQALGVRYGRYGLAQLAPSGPIESRIAAYEGVSAERVIDALGLEIERALTRDLPPDQGR